MKPGARGGGWEARLSQGSQVQQVIWGGRPLCQLIQRQERGWLSSRILALQGSGSGQPWGTSASVWGLGWSQPSGYDLRGRVEPGAVEQRGERLKERKARRGAGVSGVRGRIHQDFSLGLNNLPP